MHLVERMNPDLGMPQCLICGKGNTPGKDGKTVGPFLDLEREVNWGDPAYLCEDCGTKIGGYFNMITPEDKQDLEYKIKEQNRKIHDLESKLEVKSRRARAAESKLETLASAKKIVRQERSKVA